MAETVLPFRLPFKRWIVVWLDENLGGDKGGDKRGSFLVYADDMLDALEQSERYFHQAKVATERIIGCYEDTSYPHEWWKGDIAPTLTERQIQPAPIVELSAYRQTRSLS